MNTLKKDVTCSESRLCLSEQILHDISIRLVYATGIPDTVHGATSYDKDTGSYLIIINADLPEQEQIEALIHELTHIKLGHFDPRNAYKSMEELEQ